MSQAAESTLPYYPFEVRVYDAEIIIAELVQEIEAVEIEHMHALTRALEEMGEGKKWKVVTVIHNYSLLDTKARETFWIPKQENTPQVNTHNGLPLQMRLLSPRLPHELARIFLSIFPNRLAQPKSLTKLKWRVSG